MKIADRLGLPPSFSTYAVNDHEERGSNWASDFYMIETKADKPIGDRAYDSDPLDTQLREEDTEKKTFT